MKVLTLQDIRDGRGFGSHDLVERALRLARKYGAERLLNCAYTDYGGSILDRAYIEAFKESDPDRIVWERTSWNGQNAYIYLTDDELDTIQDYPLLDFVEEKLNEIESELYEEALELIFEDLDFYGYRYDPSRVRSWWMGRIGYYHVEPNFVDFCEQDLFKEMEKEGLVKKVEEVV